MWWAECQLLKDVHIQFPKPVNILPYFILLGEKKKTVQMWLRILSGHDPGLPRWARRDHKGHTESETGGDRSEV